MTPGHRRDRHRIHGLFTLSGACALVYQLGWVRYFTLEFGSTTLAVATVVAVFMGGLAVGALWGGRLGAYSRRPLRTYGGLELTLTLYVALSPWTFPWLLSQLGLVTTAVHEGFGLLTTVRFMAAVLLILPPTLLMGATLPVLTAWMVQQTDEGTLRATTLYSWNTIGAMLGVMAGGFWLLPQLGLQATILIAAAANLVVAASCLLLSLRYPALPPRTPPRPPESAPIVPEPPACRIPVAVGIGVALAAAGTMACQVIWTRVATLVLGASTYAFTVVLATFLAGLGLGALAASEWLRRRPARARELFIELLFAAAVTLVATGYLFPFLPVWTTWLYHALDLAANGSAIIYLQLIIAAVLLLPPTLLFGGIFPAALRAFGDTRRPVSRDIGALFAWDVLGSIAGVLLAGFLLLPVLGISLSLLVATSMLLIATCAVQLPQGPAPALKVGLVASALGAVVWFTLPPWDRQLMTSGAHSYASAYRQYTTPEQLSAHLRKGEELLYYADGLTATISVTRDRNLSTPEREILYIYTDGKIDGSSYFDMPTQRLAAHLPMLLHPHPSNIAVIGMGTGSTAGSAALHDGTRIRLIEIEARMVDGARLFQAHNHAVHERPNVDIVVTDGRLHLLRQRNAYDVIVSVPSNPWMAGSSDLFTADFFQRASGALNEQGIFAQWVQLYGMSSDNFRMILRGFLRAFPETVLATTIVQTDVLLIGSKQPFVFDPDRIGQRMAAPRIAADLADQRIDIHTVHELLARIRILPEPLHELAGSGVLHSDDHPLLAYRAPLDLYRNTRQENEARIAVFAGGIGSALTLQNGTAAQLRQHRQALAEAYERFRPDGLEAVETRRLLLAEP